MDENEGQIVNFERICRLCLNEKRTLTDIFESSTDNNNNLRIDQKIMACATIDLSKGDGLPSRICVKCLSSVNAAFDFRVQCENADKTLHILHSLLNNETENLNSEKSTTSDISVTQDNETVQIDLENEKEKEDVEQIILIKREADPKIKDNEGNLYYVIKGDDGEFVEGVLSEAEIVYYDKGNHSELTDWTDNKVRGEEGEKEDDEELEEDDEEIADDVDEEVIMEELEDEEMNCEAKSSDGDKRYKVIIKSPSDDFLEKGAQLKKYKRTGDEVQKLPCPFCNKMLTRVDEHIRLMHRNKVYICNKYGCGAQFSTLKNLQSHQLTCYDIEKAYKCPYCFKEFHRKSNFKAHVRRHNSKKEFQCQLCDSAFIDTTGLRRHFLKHHEPEREYFVSNCCGKRFKSKEGLKKHINRRICGFEVLQVVDPSPIEVPM